MAYSQVVSVVKRSKVRVVLTTASRTFPSGEPRLCSFSPWWVNSCYGCLVPSGSAAGVEYLWSRRLQISRGQGFRRMGGTGLLVGIGLVECGGGQDRGAAKGWCWWLQITRKKRRKWGYREGGWQLWLN
ncbi:hypothetical protein RHGRI_003550 [Rhododendron griersonianum]|uniref:Uncharacterized protein n=1 Tax=Rhododendron griersonianum TaxID=479676 RepID=A0AAV6L5X7_9ERIC|nr:hypothetical protein RHGRI_003550 [Rhododendron griersonianum]